MAWAMFLHAAPWFKVANPCAIGIPHVTHGNGALRGMGTEWGYVLALTFENVMQRGSHDASPLDVQRFFIGSQCA